MMTFHLPKEGGLIEKDIPKGILHSYERVTTEIFPDDMAGSAKIADLIISAVQQCKDRPFKLGLTTGRTPVSLYNILSARYEAGEVSFRNVEVISIDEYYPFGRDELQSRNHRLHEALLDKVDIPKENIHIPDGTLPKEQVSAFCAEYDRIARNLDLLVIGVGEQGQLGFNEAGSSPKSRTRTVRLSYQSHKRQARNFNGDMASTPAAAITIGLGTMLSAKKIILMAWGEAKAHTVKAVAEGPVDPACPASYL